MARVRHVLPDDQDEAHTRTANCPCRPAVLDARAAVDGLAQVVHQRRTPVCTLRRWCALPSGHREPHDVIVRTIRDDD